MEVYQRGHVTVDEHFARFGSKSYAINKITSVAVNEDIRERNGWLVFAILAGFCALALFGGLAGGNGDGAPGLVILTAVFGVPAYLMFRNRRSEAYHLMLATAAGEVQATQSPDKAAIIELRDVLERRIAGLPD